MTPEPATDSAETDRQFLRPIAVAMAALVALSVGYEAGSVLAGDSLDLFWLLPAFGGAFTVFLLLADSRRD